MTISLIAALSTIALIAGITYPLPQVIRCIHRGSARGISRQFLLIWLLDKLAMTVVLYLSGQFILMLKYLIASTFVLIIMYYKWFPRSDK